MGDGNGEMATTVLICDDHPIVRSGLRGLLDGEPDLRVVGEAADGAEAVGAAGRMRPDVILMDLKMPNMDGVAAITEIKRWNPEAKILVLTTYGGDPAVVRAVEEGASSLMAKDAPQDELCAAIRRTARGENVLTPSMLLSERQVRVLESVARGVTRAQDIGEALHVSERTVKNELSEIYNKLGVNDKHGAVGEALRRGLIETEPSSDSILSEKEVEVLTLAARGGTTADIMRGVFASRRTVSARFTSIYRKLGVEDRSQAVGEALRRGLIRADP